MAHESDEQPVSPTTLIAAQVRQLRKSYGWSGERLAAEMTAAGVKWDRMVVTNLELGRRASVSVSELLALGFVLDVPPLALLTPLGRDVRISVAADFHVGEWRLFGWLTGAGGLPDRPNVSADAERLSRWRSASEPFRLYRELVRARDRLFELEQDRNAADNTGDNARVQAARASYVDGLREWAQVLQEMRGTGIEPPAVGWYEQAWVDDAREMGFLGGDRNGG